MGVTINFNLNIKKFKNIKNFKLRLFSTLLLIFIFSTLFFIGNPVLPIFLIILFLAILYEFNLVCHNNIKLIHLIKIFIFPILLFTFLLSAINNFSPFIYNYTNYFLLLSIALIVNCVFFYNYKNTLNFVMSQLLIISFFSLIKILLSPNGLNIFLYLIILVSVMDIFAYVG